MFNPVVVGAVLTTVLLVIAMWAMATQDGEDMEGEDYSYFATDKKEHKEAADIRRAA